MPASVSVTTGFVPASSSGGVAVTRGSAQHVSTATMDTRARRMRDELVTRAARFKAATAEKETLELLLPHGVELHLGEVVLEDLARVRATVREVLRAELAEAHAVPRAGPAEGDGAS